MAEAVLDHARMLAGRNHEGHCDVAEAMEGQARIEAGPVDGWCECSRSERTAEP